MDEVFRASIIDHAYLQAEHVSLCVFDECHHTKGRAPMARIMERIHSLPEQTRPHILGLTASFNDGRASNLASKRCDLEHRLLSSVWAPPPNDDDDGARFSSIDDWDPLENGEQLKSWAVHIVEEHLRALEDNLGRMKKLEKVALDAAHVLCELGMRAFVYYLTQGIFPELEQKTNTRINVMKEELAKHASDSELNARLEMQMRNLRQYQESLPEVRNVMLRSADRLHDSIAAAKTSYELGGPVLKALSVEHTDKACRLLRLLREIDPERQKKGIIFVQQTALLYPMTELLSRHGLRVAAVGGGCMSKEVRRRALEDFKKTSAMWLVATPVLEEGHDVPDCQVESGARVATCGLSCASERDVENVENAVRMCTTL